MSAFAFLGDFQPIPSRDYAWAAPWRPLVVLPSLSVPLPRRGRSGRLRLNNCADEGAAVVQPQTRWPRRWAAS